MLANSRIANGVKFVHEFSGKTQPVIDFCRMSHNFK